MPSGRPRPHKGQTSQRHVLAIQSQMRDLQGQTLEGWRALTSRDNLPQLEELRRVCVDLLDASQALKGRNLDSSRGGGDFISADGRSTVEGRATLAHRDKLAYIRRQLENVLRSFAELDGGRKAQIPKRRCLNESCPHRGRRQPVFYQFCGYCGQSMEEAA